MITISVCMIVRNEEAHLQRCVDSLKGLYDELIIVDTGSTDATKEIAGRLGARVFDYVWQEDFADARNFAFSHATCEYIYSADADETLDEDNRKRFLLLKEYLDKQIDIVQMWYRNQLEYDTVYNYDKELRAKLFKRVRSFIWEGAVHEQVRVHPVVFDSDIEIDHHPSSDHSARDLEYFRKMTENGETLPERLHDMYARELCKAGRDEDFQIAREYFVRAAEDAELSGEGVKQSFYILARAAMIAGDEKSLMRYALRDVASEASAEMCFELGVFYRDEGDIHEAMIWFYNAAYETTPLLDVHRGSIRPLTELAACARALGDDEGAARYEAEAKEREQQHYA
ncbi:MAG: glycosyltransferase family 2 protein [Lachnospiraceae bacterium]|nr:glycosyltransferase family 2 protein [Lachnospiraceae bacterium]